jgi:predicted phosphoadenosine phosphosulfate sulfurtransferase
MDTVKNQSTFLRSQASFNVVEAAKMRIINAFSNGLPVYMSFSGGKDSLVMADIIYRLIQEGQIDKSLLKVVFIDEEAIFPCVERIVRKWRKQFEAIGVPFYWYCLEVKHYNCFNQLENDESFICWDSRKRNEWIRQPPEFAITFHRDLKPRKDRYQIFLDRINRNGIQLVGVRLAESVQRLSSFTSNIDKKRGMSKHRILYPLYDMKDDDIWLYLYEHKIEIPDAYMYLWQTGRNRRALRISQFFSIDTASSLVKMNEYYPDLMERIIKREPGAYLAAMYWDSEMFARSTRTRRALEGEDDGKDYKALSLKLIRNKNNEFNTPQKLEVLKYYRRRLIKMQLFMNDSDWKKFYEFLLGGDPKVRNIRGLYTQVMSRALKEYQKGKK